MHPDTLHRYSAYRAACKQWGVALGVGILLAGALGRLEAASLLCAALPLLLLGLVEAGYAGQERRCVELLQSKKAEDALAGLRPESGVASIVRTGQAALSVGVWPFYLALFGIVAAGTGALSPRHEHPAAPAVASMAAKPAGCGSGGCGSAAGCGSGGCGASAGKACSCSGGAGKAVAQKPVQPYLQTTTGPMALPTVAPRPLNAPALPVRVPLNAMPPRNMPPGITSPKLPATPGVRPALPPSVPAANPPAPAPSAPAPAGPNP